MLYFIIFGFGIFLGFKLSKAFALLRDARDIKFIKCTVEKILDTKENIEIIKNKQKEKFIDLDYQEYKKFKEMHQGEV